MPAVPHDNLLNFSLEEKEVRRSRSESGLEKSILKMSRDAEAEKDASMAPDIVPMARMSGAVGANATVADLPTLLMAAIASLPSAPFLPTDLRIYPAAIIARERASEHRSRKETETERSAGFPFLSFPFLSFPSSSYLRFCFNQTHTHTHTHTQT